jgi:hypothetical protein
LQIDRDMVVDGVQLFRLVDGEEGHWTALFSGDHAHNC